MSGNIGKLAVMFDHSSFGVGGCHFEEDSSIHHDWNIGSSIDSCFQLENGVRFDFQVVQQGVWHYCELGSCVSNCRSVTWPARVVVGLAMSGWVQAELSI